MNKNDAINLNDLDLGFDLQITRTVPRASGGGTWVYGTLHEHRFEALVFPEPAENTEYEIDDSCISKLWIQRMADKRTVFNWDRGMDIAADNRIVQAIVDFLTAGLAEITYGV